MKNWNKTAAGFLAVSLLAAGRTSYSILDLHTELCVKVWTHQLLKYENTSLPVDKNHHNSAK